MGNMGTADRKEARRRAQANADYFQQPYWIHMWNGVFWSSKEPVEGGEKIEPCQNPKDDQPSHPTS